MTDQNKTDAPKISAGTSVGNAGHSPMPQTAPGAKPAGGMGAGAGSSGGIGSGAGAQSATLASHTSKPMGGTGGTGASNQAGRASSASGSGHTSQASQGGGSQGGMSDQAKQAAGQAKEMAGQAQEKAGELYEQATDWAKDTYEQATEWASDAARRGGKTFNRANVRQGASGVQRYVAENPVMVGLIGLAAGLLIGALLPRTRREDETFGEWADEVREQGMRYAHDMAQRGREFVEESFSGDDPRFAQHESEFRTRNDMSGQNRH